MFIGAACNDGDHKGENDPKSKDNDVDTATGKILFVNSCLLCLFLDHLFTPDLQ